MAGRPRNRRKTQRVTAVDVFIEILTAEMETARSRGMSEYLIDGVFDPKRIAHLKAGYWIQVYPWEVGRVSPAVLYLYPDGTLREPED